MKPGSGNCCVERSGDGDSALRVGRWISAGICGGRYGGPAFKQIWQLPGSSLFRRGRSQLVVSLSLWGLASWTGRDAQSLCAENYFFILFSAFLSFTSGWHAEWIRKRPNRNEV